MSIQPGQSIGRYHILEPLGEGGMAIVYKAYDTRLECEVAVKFIRMAGPSPELIDLTLKRFEREAKSVARLTQSHIVKVTDYGEFQGTPYLVMPFLPGGTLKQLTGTRMPFQKAAHMLGLIARALEYAHSQGVLHRDVKPSNILLTGDSQPMLTDFGVAKLLERSDTQSLTGDGVGVGTPEYMAPEQAMGKPVDGRTDIYALGVVYYELVTGRKPFIADTPVAVILKHISDPLPAPRSLAPDLPIEVERLLIRALAKQPEDRYSSMTAFAEALEKLAAMPSGFQAGWQPTVPLTSAQKEHAGGPAQRPDPGQPVVPPVQIKLQHVPQSSFNAQSQPNLQAAVPASSHPAPDQATPNRSSWIVWTSVALFGLAGLTIVMVAAAVLIWRSFRPSSPTADASTLTLEAEETIQAQIDETVAAEQAKEISPSSTLEIFETGFCPALDLPSPEPSGIVQSVILSKETESISKRPIDPTQIYDTSAIFHAVVAIKNAPVETVIKAVWYVNENEEGAQCNEAIDEFSLATDGTRNIDFSLTPDTTWYTGTYRVEIYVNGVLDHIATFIVE